MKQTSLRGKFIGSAVASILAMLPLALFELLGNLKIIKSVKPEIMTILYIIVAIGFLVWAICMFTASSDFSKRGKITTGANLSGFALLLATGFLILNILVADYNYGEYYGQKEPSIVIRKLAAYGLYFIRFILPFIMLTTTLVMSKYVRGLGCAITGFVLLALFPIVVNSLSAELGKEAMKDGNTLNALVNVYYFLGALLVVIGMWASTGGASDYDRADDNEGYIATTTAANYQPAPIGYQPAPGYSPTYAPAPAPAPATAPIPTPAPASVPLTKAQKDQLQSLSDDQLQEIVLNPGAYRNAAYVETARSILAKRTNWERMVDLPDDKLLGMLHAAPGTYSFDELDVASMVLFTRESAQFMNELERESTEKLREIAGSPDTFYDGYVQAARRILANR